MIFKFYPSQVPSNFCIVSVDSEITSWLSSIGLHTTEFCMEKQKNQTKQPTRPGAGGLNTANKLVLATIPSLTPSPSPRPKPSSAFPSFKPGGTPPLPLAETLKILFAQGVSKRPLATWHRNSCLLTGKVPVMSKMTPTADFTQP